MKKILLLGGSAQQIVAIEVAKKRGLYTVLCDYLEDNPGQYVADKFYLVSTTDKDKVLEIAKEEKVDGVIAYASDPAAPTAVYVAEKLKLPSNNYHAVETLCNKDLFRNFLYQNGFSVPYAKGYVRYDDALNDVNTGNYHFPIIIKPVDSSGSKGITVLSSSEELEVAIEYAFSYSRSKRIIIEEYIEKKHPYLIGGDIFVVDGKIVFWGLLNCLRDNRVNPLVPVGKSFPLQLEEKDVQNVKMTLQMLIDKLDIKFGEMNVELLVDKYDRVYLVDVGPRSGGNFIPDLLGMIYGVNLVEWSIDLSMGEVVDIAIDKKKAFFASYNLHSDKAGILDEIVFSSKVEPYIIKKCIYKRKGDIIDVFDNASKALGVIFMKFNSEDEMKVVLENISEYIDLRICK